MLVHVSDSHDHVLEKRITVYPSEPLAFPAVGALPFGGVALGQGAVQSVGLVQVAHGPVLHVHLRRSEAFETVMYVCVCTCKKISERATESQKIAMSPFRTP